MGCKASMALYKGKSPSVIGVHRKVLKATSTDRRGQMPLFLLGTL